jgi:hypothetical protein
MMNEGIKTWLEKEIDGLKENEDDVSWGGLWAYEKCLDIVKEAEQELYNRFGKSKINIGWKDEAVCSEIVREVFNGKAEGEGK